MNHLYGAILGFLWPVVLLCLVLSPYLVHLSILPCAYLHLLAKMGSSKERHILWGGAPSLFGLQGAFLHTCSQEDTLKNEEYVVFYPLSGQDSAPLSLLLFWDICPEEKFQLLNLGPISLLPQNDHTTHGCHSLAGNLCSWPCCNLF